MLNNIQSFERIVEDPVGAYSVMRDRLDEYGPNAPFPEFEPAVEYVANELNSLGHAAIIAAHPSLQLEEKEVKTRLAHTNLAFDFDNEETYPYDRPFAGPYPYRPTIDAIESGLALLDKVSRLDPNSKAVPLYHFDRYAYHRHALIADPNVVLMPTPNAISYADFIRTRAVPIGFLGLAGDVLRVDRHQQSPLDFWYHDLNHVRRMVGYSRRSEERHEAHTPDEKLALYRSNDNFIKEVLMPAIVELPESASEHNKVVRRLTRVILFEILHETALTAERDVILADLLRRPIPQPFEHMMVNGERPTTTDDTEKLRTPTGNLQSGVSTLSRPDSSPITVRYFYDRALGLLPNVYNKLAFGFYDDPESPSAAIAPAEYRTPAYLLKAAREVFNTLDYRDAPSDEELLALIESREGAEEKFVYQSVATTGEGRASHTTEPLPAAEIVTKIKGLNKKVVTLSGFGEVGYEKPEEVLKLVRDRLEQYDPDNVVINIGAADVGIGSAYKVAKEIGFTTIGVVSAAALAHSGHFSDQVDRIYIVNDEQWTEYATRHAGNTEQVTTATEVVLAVSDELHAFGGGDTTAVEIEAARRKGLKVSYVPADMNHARADREFNLQHLPEDARYKGEAFFVGQ